MAGCAIKESHLTFNGKKYYRGAAHENFVGAIGEKKEPITGMNYLSVMDSIPLGKLKIKEVTQVEIDFTQTDKKSLLANVSVPVLFKGSVDTAYDDLKSGKLKLIYLAMNPEDMRAAANQSPKALNNLKKYGNKARIVPGIWTVVRAEIAKSFISKTSFDVSGIVKGIQLAIGGGVGSSGTTTINFGEGSTLAYTLLKLEWNEDKTRIREVKEDPWGL